jgi:hypothetical protein
MSANISNPEGVVSDVGFPNSPGIDTTPLGLTIFDNSFPRVAAKARQRWAGGRNPVGVEKLRSPFPAKCLSTENFLFGFGSQST